MTTTNTRTRRPSFTVTPDEVRIIGAIVDRWNTQLERANLDPPDKRTTVMDLTACHANGCPLDLPGLLAASKFDLSHDVIGIRDHIDRKTGVLSSHFLPRYSLESRTATTAHKETSP